MAKQEEKTTEVLLPAKQEEKTTEAPSPAKQEENKNEDSKNKPICGIIMPISAIDNCPREHWDNVKKIISEAINDAGYQPKLVSDAEDIGIIHKRIIQNIYNNDIVVCDVSGRNPNVMFELGMRLAFDKPAIIIIDDKTDYSFDTSLIEHLTYPRDLRYFDILEFKNQLKGKILATVNATKTTGSNNTSFLKNFGEFEVAHVEKKKGTIDDVLLNKIDEISRSIFRLERRIDVGDISRSERRIDTDELFMSIPSEDRIKEIIKGRLTDYSRQYFVSLQGLKLDYPILPDKLIKYMEENSELRALCHNRSTLERYLRKVIMES